MDVDVRCQGMGKIKKMNYEWKYGFGKLRKEIPCVSNMLILDPVTHVLLRLLAGIQTGTVGNWQQNISVSWRWTDYHTDVFESKCKWETTKNISIRPYALAGQNVLTTVVGKSCNL